MSYCCAEWSAASQPREPGDILIWLVLGSLVLFPLIAVLNNPPQFLTLRQKVTKNTRTSQKQMGSHNTRTITTSTGHFHCLLSKCFLVIGKLFSMKKFFQDKVILLCLLKPILSFSQVVRKLPKYKSLAPDIKNHFKGNALFSEAFSASCAFYTDWLLVLTDILVLSRKLYKSMYRQAAVIERLSPGDIDHGIQNI